MPPFTTHADSLREALVSIIETLRALGTHYSKISAGSNQVLIDQVEEEIEVLESLAGRIEVNRAVWVNTRVDPISSALLTDFSAIHAYLGDNDGNLKAYWSHDEASEGIESMRERALKGYATAISLAYLSSQAVPMGDQTHAPSNIPANLHEVDVAQLGSFVEAYTIEALTTAVGLITKEHGAVEDEVADFASSDGARSFTDILRSYMRAINRKQQAKERERELSQLLVSNLSYNDLSEPSMVRTAAASTIDFPLDPDPPPMPSPLPIPGSPDTREADDMYSNVRVSTADFRPSFVPSVTDLGGTLDNVSLLETSERFGSVSLGPVPAPAPSLASGEPPAIRANHNRNSAGQESVETHSVRYVRSSEAGSSPSPTSNGQASLAATAPRPTDDTPHHGTSSIIAFNARDALTNAHLVDPVLGSDGLIHDRWCLLEGTQDIVKGISILGDVVQLREAIHAGDASRKDEFGLKRAAYRRKTVEMCTSTDPTVLKGCLIRLSNVLQWRPDDIEILARRGILYYRLRLLAESKDDLDKAVRLSTSSSLIGVPHLDSLRYRCLVLAEIRDVERAMADIDCIMRQTSSDPLTMSLRATIRAGKGDFEDARKDLEEVTRALGTGGGSQSLLADENRDLDLIAKGWAHSSLGEIESAVSCFELAQSLRTFDPYNVACLGISLIHHGLMLKAHGQEQEGQERTKQGLAELTSAVVVVSRSSTGEELSLPSPSGPDMDSAIKDMTLPNHAYDPFFLRGMANFALQNYHEALQDFDVAQKVRPRIVKDTGEFHCVLGILQAETGEYDAAVRSFDYAMALKPEERDNYLAKRQQYGV